MPTVYTFGEYRVCIYANDHGSPHVHVVNSGWAKVRIGQSEKDIELEETGGITRSVLRAIFDSIVINRLTLLEVWESIHGRQK